MTLQEQRDVIQAAIDGKVIERKPRYKSPEGWSITSACFNFIDYEYRVKPETPALVWCNLYKLDVSGHHEKDDAERCAAPNAQRTAVPFIELTPAVRAACEAAGIEVPNE